MTLATPQGSVVHRVLRRLVGALVEVGAAASRDERASLAVSRLRGLTSVVRSEIDGVLQMYADNPRIRDQRALRTRLIALLPSIRTSVQLLARGLDEGAIARARAESTKQP